MPREAPKFLPVIVTSSPSRGATGVIAVISIRLPVSGSGVTGALSSLAIRMSRPSSVLASEFRYPAVISSPGCTRGISMLMSMLLGSWRQRVVRVVAVREVDARVARVGHLAVPEEDEARRHGVADVVADLVEPDELLAVRVQRRVRERAAH